MDIPKRGANAEEHDTLPFCGYQDGQSDEARFEAIKPTAKDSPATNLLQSVLFRLLLLPSSLQENSQQRLFKPSQSSGVPAFSRICFADDQAEGFLIRFSKASGIDGLAGIQASTEWTGGMLAVNLPYHSKAMRHFPACMRHPNLLGWLIDTHV